MEWLDKWKLKRSSEHFTFLQRNTGTTYDAEKEHYVFNEEYVLSNNRQFNGNSRMETQPNGDATTEGQSIQVIGCALTYLATGDKKWLDLAQKCFEAYMKYFYREEVNPMPNPPAAWYCNWIVNGKEPVPADYPVNWEYATYSGFKSIPVEFVDGLTQVPHGAPYFGEYLDVVTFAFDGHLTTDSINASVKFIDETGQIIWDKSGAKYDVEWVILWNGHRVNANGDRFGWQGGRASRSRSREGSAR